MAATRQFLPAPEDLELVSVLMNMKAGAPQDRSSSVSVLSPVTNRKMLSLHRKALPPLIPRSHFLRNHSKPPWSHGQLPPSTVVSSTCPMPMAKYTTTGKRVQFRDSAVEKPAPYTPEERKKALERFKEKKRRRSSSQGQIRYEVRKRLADTRPRHRGRFFKPKAAVSPNTLASQGKVVN